MRQLPAGLSWPAEDYDRVPEYNRHGGLERYLERVWKPLLPYIYMAAIREHWPRLGEAIDRARYNLPLELRPELRRGFAQRVESPTPRDKAWRWQPLLPMNPYAGRRRWRAPE